MSTERDRERNREHNRRRREKERGMFEKGDRGTPHSAADPDPEGRKQRVEDMAKRAARGESLFGETA
jgi:hypothetical protein